MRVFLSVAIFCIVLHLFHVKLPHIIWCLQPVLFRLEVRVQQLLLNMVHICFAGLLCLYRFRLRRYGHFALNLELVGLFVLQAVQLFLEFDLLAGVLHGTDRDVRIFWLDVAPIIVQIFLIALLLRIELLLQLLLQAVQRFLALRKLVFQGRAGLHLNRALAGRPQQR